jgi:hypothetical protein
MPAVARASLYVLPLYSICVINCIPSMLLTNTLALAIENLFVTRIFLSPNSPTCRLTNLEFT